MSPPTQQAREEIEVSLERTLLCRSFRLRGCPRPKGWNKFLLTVDVARGPDPADIACLPPQVRPA